MCASPYAIGIDVGGTRTKAGLVDLVRGVCLKRIVAPTETDRAHWFIAALGTAAEALLEEGGVDRTEIRGIGIGVPGYVDVDTGVVDSAWGFLAFMEDYPLRQRVERDLGYPCRVDNDARIIALAEALWGAGVGSDRVLALTLGTGVGVGAVCGGRLLDRNPVAHLAGHIRIKTGGRKCYCGTDGCLESAVSARAILDRYRREASQFDDHEVSADAHAAMAEIFDRADRRDSICARLVEDLVEDLAAGINNYILVFAPDTIVLGGGIAKRMTPYLPALRRRVFARPFSTYRVEITISTLHENAGILGGAALFSGQDAPVAR